MGKATGKRWRKIPLKKRMIICMVVVFGVLAAVFCAGASMQRLLTEMQFGQQDGAMEKASIVRVVDGDTIVVRLDGKQQKVRLVGIDAPESVASDESRNIPEGEEASSFLKSLVSAGQTVYLEKDVSDTDKYNRLLRYVWVEEPTNANNTKEIEEKMLEGIIVSAGYAQARVYEPDDAHGKALEKLMKEAIAAGRGVSYLWNT